MEKDSIKITINIKVIKFIKILEKLLKPYKWSIKSYKKSIIIKPYITIKWT